MFRKGFVYIVLNYIIQFANIILNLVLMRYLNSYLLGDLSIAKTWQQLVDYSHFGARFSLDRYVPIVEAEEKKKLVATVLFSTLSGALLVFFIGIFFNGSNVTVLILTACGIFISLSNVLKAYLRAVNKIDEMLKLVFWNQFIPVLIPLITFIITHEFLVYLLTSLFCYFAAITILLYREREVVFCINLYTAKKIIKKIALPSFLLFVNSLFIFIYLVSDRFFIDYTLGRAKLGDYSIITFAFSALMVIPATCAELLFVRIMQQSVHNGKRIFYKESAMLLSITIIGVVIANIVMQYFVEYFTNYGYLVSKMHFATLAVIPFALTSIYYHVMNGLDLRKEMILVNASVCLVLCIYYTIPLFADIKVTLIYYIYAKIATGWLIFLGYLLFILFKRPAKSSKDVV